MPILIQLTSECRFYIRHLESFNRPCFRDQDVDSEVNNINNLFDLDQEDSPGRMQNESQSGVVLEDLMRVQSTIAQIKDYSFSHEKSQWSDDEFDSFLNPPHELWNLEDPQLRLSFRIYLSLSAHSSEATYEGIRSSIKECYPDSTMLSFDQVRNRLKRATGILPLLSDMCVNTCLAYTGTFSPLTECPHCGERRYERHHDIEPRVPRRQFVTLPIGPQLQALWRHPISVAKVRDRLRRTKILLAQRNTDGGIQDYDDVCCGSEYLDLVESGEISDNDMVLTLSMDGAQLYRNKESDAWFGIATLIDLAPEICHAKEMVLPAFVIGGPNPPKNYDSFLFPTFAHLSACQKLGLTIWDSSAHASFTMHPWFGFGTADTVGMAELNGWVGHHGRNGCRVLCPMPGRHKPGAGTYYPVMLKPHGPLPSGSTHPDIDINSIAIPSLDDYAERLQHVLCSKSTREYERRRRETGICKPSIVSALPRSIPVPKCFPADTMHLFGLNISQLLVGLWRGSIEHTQDDHPTTWQFAVLHDNAVWQSHGASVAGASLYLPVCLESRVPRNPAEKISSGYKAVEYLVYVFGLCPALLYDVLPPKFYYHFCQLVFAARVVHQCHKSKEDLLAAHKAFLEFVYTFEILYYERKLTRLHFVRPCIHALTHIVPEHFRLGSLTELSQWTMERTIGNLGEEIRQHSDPYANLSQRVIERARTNALYALAPDFFPVAAKLPSGACDIGGNYVLLGPRELHEMDAKTLEAFIQFSDSHLWRIKKSTSESINIDRFARLLLPNGQIARSWWHEKKRPVEKVRVARNVKVRQYLFINETNMLNYFS